MPVPLALALSLLVAYLLGSLSFGVLYSRARGEDVRAVDAPGGSGIYRQYGLGAALLVVGLDVFKGVLAVLIARALLPASPGPHWTWLAVLGVVVGHNYPVFFGFDGGAGIAPLLGALLVSAPLALALSALLALAVIVPYRALLQRRLKFNAVPAATAIALPFGLAVAARYGGLPDLLAGAVGLGVRALHLLRR